MRGSETLFSILVFLLAGCGQKPHPAVVAIDPEFKVYSDRFERVSEEQGSPAHITDLSIQFGETPAARDTGSCVWNANKTPRITINRELWEERNTDLDHEIIIFHELGHCVLKRVHETAMTVADGVDDPRPKSLMYPRILDEETYAKDREAYARELFDPAKRDQY